MSWCLTSKEIKKTLWLIESHLERLIIQCKCKIEMRRERGRKETWWERGKARGTFFFSYFQPKLKNKFCDSIWTQKLDFWVHFEDIGLFIEKEYEEKKWTREEEDKEDNGSIKSSF